VGSIPAWTATGGVSFGEFQPGTQDGTTTYFSTIPDGITVAYTNDATISQTVGATVQTDVVYTLQVSLGWRNDLPSFVGSADLLVSGNQYLATGVTPAQGNWSVFTATYTGLAGDAGDPITIQLNDGQADFDNVLLSDNLTAAPAPVIGHGLPGVLAIGSVLFGATLFQRRKKHRSLGIAIQHASA
jgi:hypothetical protein